MKQAVQIKNVFIKNAYGYINLAYINFVSQLFVYTSVILLKMKKGIYIRSLRGLLNKAQSLGWSLNISRHTASVQLLLHQPKTENDPYLMKVIANRNLVQVGLALNMFTAPNPLQIRAEKLEIMSQDCE